MYFAKPVFPRPFHQKHILGSELSEAINRPVKVGHRSPFPYSFMSCNCPSLYCDLLTNIGLSQGADVSGI